MSVIERFERQRAAAAGTEPTLDVSVVIPCLNEIQSVAACVHEARAAIEKAGYAGEVIVVDNGSTDGSASTAREAGARVVEESERGYGSAYRAGFGAARGRYIVMGDADLTYDFGDLPRFLEQLEEGADLVVGTRLKGRIEPGAMPWLHRRLGNPLLTGILNLFFRTGLSDTHCGLRAFRAEHLGPLCLRTTGMELASEQIIRFAKLGLSIRELPIAYRRRCGDSKLASFPDGWRHLRLLLAHCPQWAFVFPGAVVLGLGLFIGVVVIGDIEVLGRQWEFHALAAGACLTIAGSQVLQVGMFAQVFAAGYLGEDDAGMTSLRVKRGMLLGVALFAFGAVMCGIVVARWVGSGLGPLRYENLSMVGITLVVLGLQAVVGSLFVSLLELGGAPLGWRRRAPRPARSADLSVAPEESH